MNQSIRKLALLLLLAIVTMTIFGCLKSSPEKAFEQLSDLVEKAEKENDEAMLERIKDEYDDFTKKYKITLKLDEVEVFLDELESLIDKYNNATFDDNERKVEKYEKKINELVEENEDFEDRLSDKQEDRMDDLERIYRKAKRRFYD